MRPTLWITYPMPRRSCTGSCCITSTPFTRIAPPLGSIRRLIIFSVVVLPQPDGPTSATISPSTMSKDRSPTAGAGAFGNRFVTPCSEIMGSATPSPRDRGTPRIDEELLRALAEVCEDHAGRVGAGATRDAAARMGARPRQIHALEAEP